MKINIQSLATNESKLVIQKVSAKIKTFLKNHKEITEADIKLKNDITTGNKVSEIYLKMRDKNIFAIQTASSFELATDKTILKLQKQLVPVVVATEPVIENEGNEETEPGEEAE